MKLFHVQAIIIFFQFVETKCYCNCHVGDWLAKENLCAILYTESGCHGDYWEIQPGEENPLMTKPDLLPRVFEMEPFWSKTVSSVIVREGCQLTLYTKQYFTGLNLTLAAKGTRFFDLHHFPQRKHIFYVPTWEKKAKSMKCNCDDSPPQVAKSYLLSNCPTIYIKSREIFRCIGNSEEAHLCRFKYSIGIFLNNKLLGNDEELRFMKVGNETKPVSEFYSTEESNYEVEAEIMAAINKTGVVKQWHCGIGDRTKFMAFVIARPAYTSKNAINYCCLRHDLEIEFARFSRRRADNEFCTCLARIDCWYARYIVNSIFCVSVQAYSTFLELFD